MASTSELQKVYAKIEELEEEVKVYKAQIGAADTSARLALQLELLAPLSSRLAELEKQKTFLLQQSVGAASTSGQSAGAAAGTASTSGQAGTGAGAGAAAGRPAQIDMDHLAGSPQLYANLQLQHSIRNHDQDLACTVEALVDTGCRYDLVLPGNKVKHLQLKFVRDGTTVGFGGGLMAVFSPLKVTIKVDAPGGPQEKMGYLRPACIKREYDNAHNLDTVLRNTDRWQEFPKAVDKDGTNVLELSPVRRTRQAGVVPNTILGLSGLKELGLIVDAAHSQLLPWVEIGLIV